MALLTYTSDINVLVAELITLSNHIIVPVKMIHGASKNMLIRIRKYVIRSMTIILDSLQLIKSEIK